MNNRDNGFGDAFAREVLNVMNSKEHKAIFSKTAHVDMGGLNVDMGLPEEGFDRDLGEHEVGSPKPGAVSGLSMNKRTLTPGTMADRGGIGEPILNVAPGTPNEVAEKAYYEDKGNRLMSDPALAPELIDVANKAAMGQPLSAEEKALLSSAAKKYEMAKSGGDVKNFKEDAKKEKDKSQAGMTEYEKELAEKTKKDKDLNKSEASVSMIDTLVAIADNLADKGLTVSEKLADRLIRSIVAEASVKTAGDDEKCDDKCCKKCKCEPCECKKNKEKDDE